MSARTDLIFEQDEYILIDVSHTVCDGMITYKGLPAPIICDYLTREASRKLYRDGTSFQIGAITMASNTGTYVDSPFHRYETGDDISELSLDRLANLDAVKIPVSPSAAQDSQGIEGRPQAIEPSHLQGIDIRGKAVLFETGWSCHWREDAYFENHPYVTATTAEYLKAQGAVFVGIDSYNIDDTRLDIRPCHSILLRAGIPICEHMTNLSALPLDDFRFFAVPVKVKGMGTFPVRAFGLVKTSRSRP